LCLQFLRLLLDKGEQIMATIDRMAAKAAGYSDAEIDAYERQAGLASSVAQAPATATAPKTPMAPQNTAPLTAGEVATGALVNLPSSTFNLVKGLYEAVTSPVKTVKGILDIGAGGLQNLLPEKFVKFIGEDKASREVANQVGQFYSDRYGSIEGAKRAFATDPAGVMADLSTFLTGGATLAPKGGALATKLSKAAAMVDPIQITAKGVAAAGRSVAPVVGMTTGVGTEAARQAIRAGYEGGDIGNLFIENLRGNVPTEAVLESAKQNLAAMNATKQAEYRTNMKAIKADTSVLDFAGIDSAVNTAENIATFKGQVRNQKAADAISEIKSEISNWKRLDPAQFHTPEGLDALKQKIGGILETIPYEQKTARTVAGGVYESIKKEITKQAPEYAKTMKAYSDASDLILEIERSLSLGKKASADTAMRKLQSLMRNNVQTNYGQRINLAQELVAAGGREMMPALAGQAMSEKVPRGLQRATAVPSVLGAFSTGGLPAAAGMAAVSSPRLMGEMLYGAGRVGQVASRAKNVLPDANYPAIINPTYQAGLLNTNLELQLLEERNRRSRAAGLFGQQ
jgi:hypothetical protein